MEDTKEDHQCENVLGRVITLDDIPRDDKNQPIFCNMWLEDIEQSEQGFRYRIYSIRLKGSDRYGKEIDETKFHEIHQLEFKKG